MTAPKTLRAAAPKTPRATGAKSAPKSARPASAASTTPFSIAPADAATPEQALARAFAEHIVRWARERAAPERVLETLRLAAYMTSIATSAGHVCIHVDDIAIESGGSAGLLLQDDLLASTMVGTPSEPGTHPLILDDHGRLYLHRYFDYEQRLARRLMMSRPQSGDPDKALDATTSETLDAATRETLDALFPSAPGRANWQKLAAALALSRRLAIISGGPGTGKTTTVVNLLACILGQQPDSRVALAAPTGKAAARMIDAIRHQSARLDTDLQARMPDEAYTIHRLLGVIPDSSEFRHDAGNPLPIDVLVVDEASMLDLALATKLFEAIPAQARIILLGDKDQLSAVESGAVFSELSADPTLTPSSIERLASTTGIDAELIRPASPAMASSLRDSVIWFTENYRFAPDSGIGKFARHVNGGDAAGAIDWLRAGSGDAVTWIEDSQPVLTDESVRAIIDGGSEYLAAVRLDPRDKASLFDAFGRFRVLCAERSGPRGVEGINRLAGQHFRHSLDHPLDPGLRSEWYPGRPVMVLRNDYVLKLFNGDTGLVLPDESGNLMVFFPDSRGDFRAIAPVRLPAHETAFASTVHKAQGSEFRDVLLLLPSKPTRVVTRELMYTAVTRARQKATIIGGADVIEKAIVSPTRRYSGLIDRLADAKNFAS